MNRIIAEGTPQDFDYSVVNGYILKDGHRYGRLGQDSIERITHSQSLEFVKITLSLMT